MSLYRMISDVDHYLALWTLEDQRELVRQIYSKSVIKGEHVANWPDVTADFDREPADADDPNPPQRHIPDATDLNAEFPIFTREKWERLNAELDLRRQVQELFVRTPTGEWVALDILNSVPCLDLEKSKLVYYSDGRVMDVRTYVFDESRIPPFHIFRIPETAYIEVFVNGEFKSAVETIDCRGLIFKRRWPN